jgi:amino acid transporter
VALFRKSVPKDGQWNALRAASAVLWSFFGVRRRASGREDAAQLTPLRVITAGVIGAAVFVTTIMSLAHLVVRFAGN